MQIARTRLSPSCWATSASTIDRLAVDLHGELERGVELGKVATRELDVDHRAGDADNTSVGELCFVATGESLVIVMTCALSLSNRAECRGSCRVNRRGGSRNR